MDLIGNPPKQIHICVFFVNAKFQATKPSSLVVQPGLCTTWLETLKTIFLACGSNQSDKLSKIDKLVPVKT